GPARSDVPARLPASDRAWTARPGDRRDRGWTHGRAEQSPRSGGQARGIPAGWRRLVVAESFRAFFERYASLSTGPHPEQLAALYDESFFVAAPKGSAAFRNDAAFHEWLRQVHDFNAQTGMTSLAPVELDVVSVGPQF